MWRTKWTAHGRLFGEFVYAINQCGVFLLDLPDEEIGFRIFEEFDVGAGTFLHHNTLSNLQGDGLIDRTIREKSALLRSKFMALQGTPQWNVESIKRDAVWLDIMKLSDEIKGLLHAMWSDAEMEEIYKMRDMDRDWQYFK